MNHKLPSMNYKLLFITFIYLILFLPVFAQVSSDSLKQTVPADSVVADSTKNKNSIDAVVVSTAADSVFFNIKTKKMSLYGKSHIKYKNTELNSAIVYVDFNSKNMEAYGVPDTAKKAPEGKLMDTPVLKENSENYEGKWLRYNFENKSGYIAHAKNKSKEQRYEGEKVKKLDEKNYFIEHGIFTTCDSDTPDTHFSARRMKVIDQEAIVAEWIFMHIAEIPLPIPLPFGVFPTKNERRSGLIIGTYGYGRDRGHLFENFGYYWAINDYLGSRFTGTWTTRGGYNLSSNLDYNLRYKFNGNVSVAYAKTRDNNSNQSTQWNFGLRHSQIIDPTSSISANINFASSNYYYSTATNPQSALQSQIQSNASYSKTWETSSLNISYSRSQDIQSGNVYEVLPDVSFRKSQFYPFRAEKKSPGNYQWIDHIYMSYSANALNKRNKIGEINREQAGLSFDMNISASPKLGFFNISPSATYSEKWFNTRIVKEEVMKISQSNGKPDTSYTEKSTVVKEIQSYRDFSLNIGLSTKVYGTLNLNILGVEAFRHTMNPSVSFSYTPDFSDDRWGYFDYYTTHKGEKVKYSKFDDNVFGGPRIASSKILNFSVANFWEIKMQKAPEDTTNEQEKINLLNFNFSSSYNLDTKELSDLYTGFNTTIGNNFNFNGNTTFTFYDVDKDGRKTKSFLVSHGKGLFAVTSFSLSLSTSFAGKSSEKANSTQQGNNQQPNINPYPNEMLISNQNVDYSIPWDLRVSAYYNWSKPVGGTSNENLSLNISGNMSLTSKWKIGVTTGYSTLEKKFTNPVISVNRDLHCWDLSFSWNLGSGYLSGYAFIIRMKAPQFKDIKYEKTKGLPTGIRI